MSDQPIAIKDEDAAHPIAESWRPMLCEVVCAFARGDFELKCGAEGINVVSPIIAAQNQEYVEDYGESLVELSDKTWESSCAQWMGSHWDVLIDLCTEGEGISDLVLTGEMRDIDGKPHFTAGLIYVP
jgi:hypothetical protein